MNRALLVGINSYPSSPLKGCINDINDMSAFLIAQCGFTINELKTLTDSNATKEAIINELNQLVNDIHAGDRILFHYSGHGVQRPTLDPQGEVDGLDEAICPYDFDWTDAHTIRDKEFNHIFSAIPEGVEFIWISDSCHSGDLEKELINPSALSKSLTPPDDIIEKIQIAKNKKLRLRQLSKTAQDLNLALISGCKSNQTSADALINKRYNGALTYYLLQRLNKPDGLSIPLTNLVKSVSTALRKAEYAQRPQLEGKEQIKEKPFLKI